ncbi:MAG TPA: PDZ domain-containing protein [Thermoanaerobaculia bacterium]|nr:PDZ domain-containing protein [Thermoanaerobaculia bacterium]
MRFRTLLLPILLLLPLAASGATDQLARILRYPDISGDKIAFVHAGDIWVVDSNGGVARRLTSHEGLELFPRFSPDGRWIAFSAEYSGSRQVHVISVDGGEPRQLTWYNDVGPMPPRGGWDYWVQDWTRDGRHVLVRANRLPWSERMGRLYLVPFDGGMEQPLIIPEGGSGSFSPDGTKLAYTPIDREFRTWKRYHGGRAQDVWIYDLKANSAQQITDYDGTDNQPMWIGDRIYFTSDRDGGILNLHEYDTRSRQTRKVTTHTEYDVLWPSAGGGKIVYENGGYVHRFDPATGRNEIVPIRIYGDFPETVPSFKNVTANIGAMDLSPTGARALFSARGEIFSVPAKEGEIRNLTESAGVRELAAKWSPDGRSIAYWSDRAGEYELYVRSQDGSGGERQITRGGDTWRFTPVWSPDSRRVAFADKKQTLRWVDVASGKISDVDRGRFADITTYRWSPDSRWLVYTKIGSNQLSTIWAHSLGDGTNHQLTSGRTNDYQPVFDSKGRYLYFLSDRDFNLTFSGFEFNYLYTNPTRVYVAILAADGPALFLPTSDEEKALETPEPAKGESEKKDASGPVQVRIDAAGFESRVRAIPGSPADYRSLAANDKGVFYLVGADKETKLKFFDLDAKEEKVVLEGVTSYVLSANGEKLLYRNGGSYGIVAAAAGQKIADGLLALEKMQVRIDPRLEWKQIFADGWRTLRDWFYDPGMHGLDWNAMRAKYEVLVPHVAHRFDLDYIFGELGGELSAGHVYVNAGEYPKIRRLDNGLLAAEIVPDPSGYFRVAKIFPGENWHESFRSPLTEPGVTVRTGDLILAVDGKSTRGVKNFYQLLENKADRVVTLLVNSRAETSGGREEKVRPIRKETNSRYLDWVESRRQMVDRLSGGRIGYIHLPNTAQEGNRELAKHFYPQADKEALIIDDRYNGGGFIPDRMIEILDRSVLNYWVQRGLEPSPTPGFAHQGPKVMLINGYAASGGDALPYYFRKRGLGLLIGTRTWGGLIGISGNPDFVDGGSINVPTFRFLDTEGAWAVEGAGVSPDIEVLDRPELVAQGRDPSLEKAVEVLLQQLIEKAPVRPAVPPAVPGRP